MKNINKGLLGLVIVLLILIGYWWWGGYQKIPRTAKVANECVNFSPFIGGASELPLADRTPSMSLSRGRDGCYVDLDEVKFYEKKDCRDTGKVGKVNKKIGDVVCSGLSGGCRECVLKTHNTPYIIEFWNGYEMVSYCYDFDGLPEDCNLPPGNACMHSAQCQSGYCSGGTCQ